MLHSATSTVCVYIRSLQLLNGYVMTSRELSLNTAACRLLQDIMPGLESAVVFQEKVEYWASRRTRLSSTTMIISPILTHSQVAMSRVCFSSHKKSYVLIEL